MKIPVSLNKDEKAAILAAMEDCGIFPMREFLKYAALREARKGSS